MKTTEKNRAILRLIFSILCTFVPRIHLLRIELNFYSTLVQFLEFLFPREVVTAQISVYQYFIVDNKALLLNIFPLFSCKEGYYSCQMWRFCMLLMPVNYFSR